MHTARSASRVWRAPRSASEYTATLSKPSTRHARMTRTASAPRLATSTRFTAPSRTPNAPGDEEVSRRGARTRRRVSGSTSGVGAHTDGGGLPVPWEGGIPGVAAGAELPDQLDEWEGDPRIILPNGACGEHRLHVLLGEHNAQEDLFVRDVPAEPRSDSLHHRRNRLPPRVLPCHRRLENPVEDIGVQGRDRLAVVAEGVLDDLVRNRPIAVPLDAVGDRRGA